MQQVSTSSTATPIPERRSRYFAFESHGDHIVVGASSGKGQENRQSLIVLNVCGAQPVTAVYGTPIGEPVDIALALSVEQVALIVRSFFSNITYYPTKNMYRRFLTALLRRRREVMTSYSGFQGSDEELLGDYHQL